MRTGIARVLISDGTAFDVQHTLVLSLTERIITMNVRMRTGWVLGLFSLLAVSSADAQLVQFTGLDAGSASPGVNSVAARNAFITATGGSVVVDFERTSVRPPGFSFSQGTLKDSTFCGLALCGGNSTPKGETFLELLGQSTTFTFGQGINFFGGFFGGVQLQSFLTFSDGSTQRFAIPDGAVGGGFAFAGFTDFNRTITAVTVEVPCSIGVPCDIISVDDLIFGNTTVAPEPSTYAMMMFGMGAIGFTARRRRKG